MTKSFAILDELTSAFISEGWSVAINPKRPQSGIADMTVSDGTATINVQICIDAHSSKIVFEGGATRLIDTNSSWEGPYERAVERVRSELVLASVPLGSVVRRLRKHSVRWRIDARPPKRKRLPSLDGYAVDAIQRRIVVKTTDELCLELMFATILPGTPYEKSMIRVPDELVHDGSSRDIILRGRESKIQRKLGRLVARLEKAFGRLRQERLVPPSVVECRVMKGDSRVRVVVDTSRIREWAHYSKGVAYEDMVVDIVDGGAHGAGSDRSNP